MFNEWWLALHNYHWIAAKAEMSGEWWLALHNYQWTAANAEMFGEWWLALHIYRWIATKTEMSVMMCRSKGEPIRQLQQGQWDRGWKEPLT
eukprot:1138308-Pelagomonas_calceolata.AAC.4